MKSIKRLKSLRYRLSQEEAAYKKKARECEEHMDSCLKCFTKKMLDDLKLDFIALNAMAKNIVKTICAIEREKSRIEAEYDSTTHEPR